MSTGKRVQELPAPPGLSRVETGAVQFGPDWPGLFLRGDNAHSLMLWIRQLARLLADHPNPQIADVLAQLTHYADLIDRDVIVQ
jgi:hypothetical protein